MLVLEDECEQHRMIPKEVNVEHVFVNPLKPNKVDCVLTVQDLCMCRSILVVYRKSAFSDLFVGSILL